MNRALALPLAAPPAPAPAWAPRPVVFVDIKASSLTPLDCSTIDEVILHLS